MAKQQPLITPDQVPDYLKKANQIATIAGQQQDLTTLRGRTTARDLYESGQRVTD